MTQKMISWFEQKNNKSVALSTHFAVIEALVTTSDERERKDLFPSHL